MLFGEAFLREQRRCACRAKIRSCTFAADSPERDMAWFEVRGVRVMMKIDYYDADFEWGSEDPTNAAETRRAITLMRPEDY